MSQLTLPPPPTAPPPTRPRITRVAGSPAPWVTRMLWILLFIGIGVFIWLLAWDPMRLWTDYLAEFIFFTGMAQAGVVFSAVTRGCNGRWARPVMPLAEGLAVVLPVSCLLFIPIMLAHRYIYPWWDHMPYGKGHWLNHGFLLGRDLGILIFMAWLSCRYLYWNRRRDLGEMFEPGAENDEVLSERRARATWLQRFVCRKWRGLEAERARAERSLKRLWVLILFAYCYFWGILGLDLNMSLDPVWYDYIYDWYFWLANWYGGLGIICILTTAWRNRLGVRDVINRDVLHDVGEMTFAFCIFWTYLFWAQFMILWYANRQDDIHLLLLIARTQPWETIGWIIITLGFFLPFAFGLSRAFKRRGPTLATIACFTVAAIWLERNLIVDASIWKRGFPPLLTSAGIGCLFLGLYGLIYLWFMRQTPFFPVQDPEMTRTLVVSLPRH